MNNVLDKKIISKISFADPVCADYLSQKIYEQITMPFVVLCLGTDKDISDSLGPISGHFLSSDKTFRSPVFGTLSRPVHKENLLFNLDIIRHRYPAHSLLVIDAAMGEKENLGEIMLLGQGESSGIRANHAVAGGLTLLGVSDYEGSRNSWLNSVRLNTVYEMAQVVAKALTKAVKIYSL